MTGNECEFVPTDEGFVVVSTHPDGEMHTYLMTLDQFARLKAECDAIDRGEMELDEE